MPKLPARCLSCFLQAHQERPAARPLTVSLHAAGCRLFPLISLQTVVHPLQRCTTQFPGLLRYPLQATCRPSNLVLSGHPAGALPGQEWHGVDSHIVAPHASGTQCAPDSHLAACRGGARRLAYPVQAPQSALLSKSCTATLRGQCAGEAGTAAALRQGTHTRAGSQGLTLNAAGTQSCPPESRPTVLLVVRLPKSRLEPHAACCRQCCLPRPVTPSVAWC